MYDISFVRKTLHFRQQVLNGEPVENPFNLLEECRQKDPKIYQVETTNACNMTCVMCPRTTLMDRDIGHMSGDTFMKLIDQLSGFSKDELNLWDSYVESHGLKNSLASEEDYFYHFIASQCITLHGFGEPLMDPNLVKRIKYCTKKGFRTYFSANPVNVRLKVMDQLGKAGLSFIKFHLDGVDNEAQLFYRGRVDKTYKETQNRILEVINLFEEKGYPTKVVLTKLKFNNEDELDKEFIEFWKEHNVFSYIKNQHNRWLYEEENSIENSAEYMHRYCEFPWTSVSVLQNGDVVPCPMEYNGEESFGNAEDQSLKEIWNGKKYENFRRMHVNGNFPKGHFCVTKCDIPKLYEKLHRK